MKTCARSLRSHHGLAALALAASALLPACSAPASPADAPKPPDLPLRAQIAAAIGDAACSRDDQCRTLPVGHKPCGGPQSWMAWSTARSDGAALAALAERDAAAQRAEQERLGMRSTCSVVPDPGAACVAQRCTLRTAPSPAQ